VYPLNDAMEQHFCTFKTLVYFGEICHFVAPKCIYKIYEMLEKSRCKNSKISAFQKSNVRCLFVFGFGPSYRGAVVFRAVRLQCQIVWVWTDTENYGSCERDFCISGSGFVFLANHILYFIKFL